jgi:hypothetical protein
MKERALAFDDIPVSGRGGRAEHLGCARDEIRDHRIERHSCPRYQDAGLTGGAEIGVDARRLNARASARAVYFLPSAQSVPTVSSRLPERFSPVAIGIPGGGVRTSMS